MIQSFKFTEDTIIRIAIAIVFFEGKDNAEGEKKEESRKSLIFRTLPLFAFALSGPTRA